MGILLYLISIILSLILFPIGLLFSLIKFFWKRKFCQGLINFDNKFLSMATSIDVLGNVVCSELFNQVLINKNGYKFGNRKETISSCIGKNKRAGTLTKTGLILSAILDFIDKNHSLDSIDILV